MTLWEPSYIKGAPHFPSHGMRVLVWSPENGIRFGMWTCGVGWRIFDLGGSEIAYPKFWMPLPEAPANGENEQKENGK